MRKLLALTAIALTLAACGSATSSSPGSSPSSSTTSHVTLAKTKFVLHAGLAFGAFHRYIYKPFRAGEFSHPFSHKIMLIKAGVAALFIRHELRLALTDAQSSPTLSKLVSPITSLEHRLSGDVKSGGSALNQDNSAIRSLEQQSSSSGQPITESAPSHL